MNTVQRSCHEHRNVGSLQIIWQLLTAWSTAYLVGRTLQARGHSLQGRSIAGLCRRTGEGRKAVLHRRITGLCVCMGSYETQTQ